MKKKPKNTTTKLIKTNKIMEQSAVEWLDLHLLGLISFDSEELRAMYKERIQQSKEIFEKQIIDAYETGDKYKFEVPGKEYYNVTFK